jgi:hypothetical protein
VEKPRPEDARRCPRPRPLPGLDGQLRPFTRRVVREINRDPRGGDSVNDFAQSINPEITAGGKVFAYDFPPAEPPPGPTVKERGYCGTWGPRPTTRPTRPDAPSTRSSTSTTTSGRSTPPAPHAPGQVRLQDPATTASASPPTRVSEGCINSGATCTSPSSPARAHQLLLQRRGPILFENVVTPQRPRAPAIVDKTWRSPRRHQRLTTPRRPPPLLPHEGGMSHPQGERVGEGDRRAEAAGASARPAGPFGPRGGSGPRRGHSSPRPPPRSPFCSVDGLEHPPSGSRRPRDGVAEGAGGDRPALGAHMSTNIHAPHGEHAPHHPLGRAAADVLGGPPPEGPALRRPGRPSGRTRSMVAPARRRPRTDGRGGPGDGAGGGLGMAGQSARTALSPPGPRARRPCKAVRICSHPVVALEVAGESNLKGDDPR